LALFHFVRFDGDKKGGIMQFNKKTGLMLVFFTALVSGVSIFVNKFAVAGFNPYVFTFLKNAVVAVFLLSAFFLVKDFRLLKTLKAKHWKQLALIGLIGGSIPFLLFFKGLQMTTAGFGAFIHKTMFIFIGVFALFFLKEKINKKMVAAAIMLLAGNYLFLKITSHSFNIGDLLILLATLFWAAENTLSKYVLKELEARTVAFGRMFFGSVFILAFLVVTGNINAVASLTGAHLMWVLLTSVFLMLYVLTWYTGIKYINVSVAACVLLLGSVITTVLSVIFTGAEVTLMQAFGMLLQVSGIISVITFSDTVDLRQLLPWRIKHGR